MKTDKKTEIPHYGKMLEAEIKAKGYAKVRIARKLGISFPTLAERLKDGDFTRAQLQILIDNRYLCDI